MKKVTVLSLITVLLFACNSGDSKDGKKDDGTEKKADATDLSKNPDYQKGLELIAKSDCLTCHHIDEKIQGPAYRDVANKYGSMPDTIVAYLAHKIIKGGTGNWPETTTPMIPHPGLSDDEATAMVKYILLLKNK